MVGVATVGKLTVKLKLVVLVTPLPVAETVIVEVPAGVELLVLMVKVDEQLGLQLLEEKEAVAPDGRPAAEKLIGSLLPVKRVALIVLLTEPPALTDLSPELEREKSKAFGVVNKALASELGL
jgi:hypothetical protein